jgi:hypothetical protein
MPTSGEQNNTSEEDKAKKKRKLKIAIATQVPFAIFAFVCMFILLNRNKSKNDIQHANFTKGTIFYYYKQNSTDTIFQYNYVVKGISHSGTLNFSKDITKDSLVGKTFPVIYDTTAKNGNNSILAACLLITPDDFKKYNIPFPDSLKWVLKYIKKG